MKSYTDLEQSKKLADILPVESADMCWARDDDTMQYDDKPYLNPYKNYTAKEYYLPCYSLAALLSALHYTIKLPYDTIDAGGNRAYANERYKISINRCGLFGDKWNIQYYGTHPRRLGKRYKKLYINLFLSKNYDNLVDACVEMITTLHKEKLL